MTRKVVFDTSCLISAAIRPDSIPDQAVTLALKTCQLCSSVDALEELQEVLQRRRFDTYVGLDSRIAFLQAIRSHSQVFTPTDSILNEVKGQCRDANDDFILALALAAQADIIVSSDHDLLALHPWNGIPILTPAQFVAQFSV
jgi:putative PIN family toxin of toxin-antitoxin system